MPSKRIRVLGLALLCFAALDSQALTLGRIRGAALIGQGLDVSIQVQTDPDEAASSQCFEAEVFHADARQDPARVQVSIEPTQTPQTLNVRIQSSVSVDEPVVTVYLRAGCTQKTSRRYVMLADVLSEPAVPSAARAAPLPLVVPAGTPAATSAASTGAAIASAGGAAASGRNSGASTNRAVATTAVRGKPAARPAAKSTVLAEPARKAAAVKAVAPSAAGAGAAEKLVAGRAAGQSRLKLDPLEVLSERVATLESSTASAPAEQAAREARDAQRLQSLESSVKNLLAVAARNEASLAELRARLQQAESDRYANPLVYGLVALLLVALAGLAFLLSRRGGAATGGNWWSGASTAQLAEGSADRGEAPVTRRSGFAPMSSPSPLSGPDSLPAPERAQQQAQRSGPPSKPAPITQVDVSLVEMSESTFDRLMQSGTTHSAVRKPSAAADHGLERAEPARRLINSDDLFDIRQQAEFFVSLGQTDQAVRILENRISESGESSPLAYLDLLKIFHSLGLKADFRQVREDFNLLFNARVPEFASFDSEGRDLESYPDIVDGLTAVWGMPELLPTIEALLFRDPSNSQRDAMDLAAFRDVLLLHAVAQTAPVLPDRLYVAASNSLPRSPFGNAARGAVQTPASQIAPLDAGAEPDLALPVLPGLEEVDIDLSDLSFDAPAPDAPLPPHSSGLPAAGSGGDAGNLIDFELPVVPGAAPRSGPA